MWKHIKRKFTNKLFTNLDQISDFFTQTLSSISQTLVQSICAHEYTSLQFFWSV